MADTNVVIIEKFFDAYSRHDVDDIQKVLSKNAKWTFPGHNPLSGTKKGIEEIVSFFDEMGSVMAKSKVEVERLVTGTNSDYLMECQHIKTNREDGINLNQHMCVLWIFDGGKIVEGKHLTSNQSEVDSFFTRLCE